MRIICLVTAALLVGNAVAAPIPVVEVDAHVATTHPHRLHEAPSNLSENLQHLTERADDAIFYGRNDKHKTAIENTWAAVHVQGSALGDWQHLADKTHTTNPGLYGKAIRNVAELEAKQRESQKTINKHGRRLPFMRPNPEDSSAAAMQAYDEANRSSLEAKSHLERLHRYWH